MRCSQTFIHGHVEASPGTPPWTIVPAAIRPCLSQVSVVMSRSELCQMAHIHSRRPCPVAPFGLSDQGNCGGAAAGGVGGDTPPAGAAAAPALGAAGRPHPGRPPRCRLRISPQISCLAVGTSDVGADPVLPRSITQCFSCAEFCVCLDCASCLLNGTASAPPREARSSIVHRFRSSKIDSSAVWSERRFLPERRSVARQGLRVLRAGSGKSTWAAKFAREHSDYTVLGVDTALDQMRVSPPPYPPLPPSLSHHPLPP